MTVIVQSASDQSKTTEASSAEKWPWLLAVAALIPTATIWSYAFFLEKLYRALRPDGSLDQTYRMVVVYSGIGFVRYGGILAVATALYALFKRKERVSALSVMIVGFLFYGFLLSSEMREAVLERIYWLKKGL